MTQTVNQVDIHKLMQKKVSVCIPSYNASRFIGETLRSVLDSEYRNIEIIISDDASTDDTATIIESLQDRRIRFCRNGRNEGPVRNWNRAVTQATGEYVSLLNHDDLYGPFWILFAVHHLEKNSHVGWVATAHRTIDAWGRPLALISRFQTTGEIPKDVAFLATATLDGLGPGFVVRRNILEEVGYFDENAGPGADNDLFLRLAAKYPLFYCAAHPHTSWRLHQHNLTHRYGILQQVRDGIRTLKKVFSDPCLSPELATYSDVCIENFIRNSMSYAEYYLRHEDEKTYRELLMLISVEVEEKGDSPLFNSHRNLDKISQNGLASRMPERCDLLKEC
jgi:glycosyltransferase involved in cell wall biosynthesis